MREQTYVISTYFGSDAVNDDEDAEEDHGDGGSDIKTGLSPRGDTHPGNLQVLATNYSMAPLSQTSPASSPEARGRAAAGSRWGAKGGGRHETFAELIEIIKVHVCAS